MAERSVRTKKSHAKNVVQQRKDLLHLIYYGETEEIRNNATTEFVELNIPLVNYVVKPFLGQGVEQEDLFQEGVLGLYEALEKFDIEKGFEFSTYATAWIKKNVQDVFLKYSTTIRKPNDYLSLIKKITIIMERFKAEHKRYPNTTELSKLTKIDKNRLKSITMLLYGVVSLDSKESNDLDGSRDNSLSDNLSIDMLNGDFGDELKEVYDRELKEKIENILDEFVTPREKVVLMHRFGFADNEAKSFRSVSDILKISPEGVRQLELKALRKLRRNPEVRQRLLGYKI